MAHAESSQPSLPRSESLRRMWWPIAAVVVSALGMIASRLFLADILDSGNQRLVSFVLAVLGLAAVAAWFFFGSGASRRSRLIVAVLLTASFVGGAASIRRVEFSGDMVPTFDLRWNPDRDVVLKAHRAAQEKEIAQSNALPGRRPRRCRFVSNRDRRTYWTFVGLVAMVWSITRSSWARLDSRTRRRKSFASRSAAAMPRSCTWRARW